MPAEAGGKCENMNQVEVVCLIIASVGAVFGICGFVFPLLTKKGVDTGAILGKVDSGLDIAAKAVNEIKAIAPATPYISTAESIVKFAEQGTKKAEQLYNANRISAEARKTEAVQLTKELLTASGVTVTPEIEAIIDGCVEAAVFALPQTHTEANTKRYASRTVATSTAKANQDAAAKALQSAADAVQAAQKVVSGAAQTSAGSKSAA